MCYTQTTMQVKITPNVMFWSISHLDSCHSCGLMAFSLNMSFYDGTCSDGYLWPIGDASLIINRYPSPHPTNKLPCTILVLKILILILISRQSNVNLIYCRPANCPRSSGTILDSDLVPIILDLSNMSEYSPWKGNNIQFSLQASDINLWGYG